MVLPFSKHLNPKYLLSNFSKVTNICYYLSLKNSQFFDKKNTCLIRHTKLLIDDNSCGFVNYNALNCNITFVSEAVTFNTCLNRKISIDKNGVIKNCPSYPNHYGNICDTSLIEIINKEEFKKYWYICKDKIQICSDCEFRYMCCDCRAFIKEPNNIYSKPAKCTYDPYNFELL